MSFVRTASGFLLLGTAIFAQNQGDKIFTFAGGAPPATPVPGVAMAIGSVQSVAADAMGNTYFVTFHCVFKLDQNGVVTLIAGNGRAGYSGDGGPATSAQLQLQSVALGSVWVGGGALPPGIAVDTGGNVYVADNGNYRVRRISPNGVITTVAGNGTPGFSGDGGPATSAQLSPVFGLAIDVWGNLLIADSGANRIRQVTPDGSIATVAGAGDCGFSGDGGPATAAPQLRLVPTEAGRAPATWAATARWLGLVLAAWLAVLTPFVAGVVRRFWPEELALLGLWGWFQVGPTLLVLMLLVLGLGGRLVLMVRAIRRLLHRPRRAPSTAVPAGGVGS